MRKYLQQAFLLFVFPFLFCDLSAQIVLADSARKRLNEDLPDSTRSFFLSQLGFSFIRSGQDSALLFARQGLAIANRINYVRGQAANLNTIGSLLIYKGDYAGALAILLDVLKKYESIGGDPAIVAILLNIGFVYTELGDQHKGLDYTIRAKRMAEINHDDRRLSTIFVNLGDSYEKLNQLDSARLYATMGYELSMRLGRIENAMIATGNLGNIYSKRKDWSLAMGYYHSALQTCMHEVDDPSAYAEFSLGIARIFNLQQQNDSALYYARNAYELARSNELPPAVLESSKFLAQLYKKNKRIDSAFYYTEIAAAIKDSMFGQEKEYAIQRLTFDETMRQQELIAAEQQRADERNQNIQYAIAAIGLVCFLVIALLLARSVIVNEMWIRFLGILGLLLVFEFINLFIHPFLTRITHHSPLWMLLVMVIIAAVLIPLHHRLEYFIVHTLTRRNKAIRLAAARKTIAKLEAEQHAEAKNEL